MGATYKSMIDSVVRRMNADKHMDVTIERRTRPHGSDFRFHLSGDITFSPDFRSDMEAYWWLVGFRDGVLATIDNA